MYETSLASVTAEVETLLSEKFSVRGRNLAEKVHNAGRRLPRRIRAQFDYLVEAEARYQNPKTAHQYDPARVVAARDRCVRYLQKVDVDARRSYRRLAWLTGALVNLFILGLLFFAVTHYLR